MKILEEQVGELLDAMAAERRRELRVRLVERGKLIGVDEATIDAEIDALVVRAHDADIYYPHDMARFVELFFLLSPQAKASRMCRGVIEAVLAARHVFSEARIDFLYRHVLPRTDWPF